MRLLAATLRIALGAALLGSVIWQVTDRIAHNVFRPGEYFTYFTVDTSIATGILMLIAGGYALRAKSLAVEPRWLSLARLGLVTSSVIVAVVYNVLLRNLPPLAADAGYEWPTVPNDILHVWAPIVLVIEWLLFAPHKRLSWKTAFATWAYPFAWLVFTLVRGSVDGWWPYFFINPNDEGGVTGMIGYILGIMAFLFVVASVVMPAQRVAQARLVRVPAEGSQEATR